MRTLNTHHIACAIDVVPSASPLMPPAFPRCVVHVVHTCLSSPVATCSRAFNRLSPFDYLHAFDRLQSTVFHPSHHHPHTRPQAVCTSVPRLLASRLSPFSMCVAVSQWSAFTVFTRLIICDRPRWVVHTVCPPSRRLPHRPPVPRLPSFYHFIECLLVVALFVGCDLLTRPIVLPLLSLPCFPSLFLFLQEEVAGLSACLRNPTLPNAELPNAKLRANTKLGC